MYVRHVNRSVDSAKPNADATWMWKFEATTNFLYKLYELAVITKAVTLLLLIPYSRLGIVCFDVFFMVLEKGFHPSQFSTTWVIILWQAWAWQVWNIDR